MTEAQRRALWAIALRNLADAIMGGYATLPTSIDIWTQYVTPGELLAIADNSYTTPLPISLYANHASVRIPTGELLGLPIEWKMQCDLATDERERNTLAFTTHNDECLPAAAPDSEVPA